jgi:UPF0716 family protein affecting phage T7 exclusion
MQGGIVRPNRSLFVLLYIAAEAALLYWVWSAFGMAALAVVLVAGFMLGILVMRIAGLQAFSALTNAQRRAEAFGVTAADGSEQVVHAAAPGREEMAETAEDLGKSSLLFVAGVLLAVPGILSSVAGLVMLLPLVRTAMARRMARSMSASAQASARITVVTADEAGFTAQQWSTGQQADRGSQRGRGSTDGPVIQGEILPPPRDPGHY